MTATIKLIKGLHITAAEKKAIRTIIEVKQEGCWKVGKKDYNVVPAGDNTFTVEICQNMRSAMTGTMQREKNTVTIEYVEK